MITIKSPTTQHPQPLGASLLPNQDDETQIRLDDSRYRSFPPPRRAVQRSTMPIPMQEFEFPRRSNEAPRHFPTIDEVEYTEVQPYRSSEEGFVGLTNRENVVQSKRESRSRPWMQTLQTQDRIERYKRRRPATKWMKWMNSDWKNHIVAVIGELIGTTLFLFFGYAGIEVAKLQDRKPPDLEVLFYISATFGASLMVNAWIFFRISGGLFNPAVTLALALLRAVSPVRAVLLVITQLGASCLAAILVKEIFPNRLDVATSLGSGTSIAQGFVIEGITTAALIFTIIMLAVEKHKATFVAPIGIGLALFVAHMVAVPFTGASLNPARSFGPSAIVWNFPREHWIYWVGPILGAGLAVLFFRLIKLMEYEMANPGQDGDPENDPTQNPEHDVAQNAHEREEEVFGFKNGKSWYRDESSIGSIRRNGSISSLTGSKRSIGWRGEMSRRLDDVEAQWQRQRYPNVI
ncbi:hypothetical protein SBOR_5026 [Sclerotinia borealis F-4128]|uniref:Aquaporin n=1 Tax=Sclerotinia borealis (strain F-4128) TaxID=1432307 RepID=W9CJA5_SCLBF|nr:hypothetical protein SBOR_5026 [Sclerotinia borealis F-4128]